MSKVKMFWWNEQANFGDALNPVIIEKLFGLKAEWTPLEQAELVGAGSCLQWVAKAVNDFPHEIHIWGTGYMYDKEPPINNKLVSHHAVRGVHSLKFGRLSQKTALGDPGILAPLLVHGNIEKTHKIGIVPHLWNLDDEQIARVRKSSKNINIIDVRLTPLEVIKQISGCEFIFSSSLHGLIIADSFGIPNQWVEFSKKLFGGSWKFNDYYSIYKISPQEAIMFDTSMTSAKAIQDFLGKFEPRNNIEQLQKELLTSFPKSFLD